MIGLRATTRTNTRRVKRASDQSTVKSLGHAAAATRLIAKRSIKKRKAPADPGDVVHTQTRKLPRSIKYDANQDSAIIGADKASIGAAAEVHEHGGRLRGTKYAPRPFMRPALQQIRKRLPRFWRATIR